MFPLIQLPRKSEEIQEKLDRAESQVSINSTSEEVRSFVPFSKLLEAFDFEVSINSTSEEVRSIMNPEKFMEQMGVFPLIQLPRKSEAACQALRQSHWLVSINSTSEEVRRKQ